MNIDQYIQSGILEQYCLGLTSKEENQEMERLCTRFSKVREELESVQKALGVYVNNFQAPPRSQLKNTILYAIDELDFVEPPSKKSNKAIDLSNPPLIHENSNLKEWLKAIEGLEPVAEMEGMPVHPLRMDEKVMMAVVWVEEGVPAEQHTNEAESFLLLEGACTCTVGKAEHRLQSGDFLGIPTYTNHSLKVTSAKRIKLIVQRVKLVA